MSTPHHPSTDWFGYSLILLFLALLWWAFATAPRARAATLDPLPSRQFVSAGVLAQGGRGWTPHDPQHREPPEGWFCTNDPRGAKDHQCSCEHKCVPNQPDPETGEPAQPGNHVEENAKCSVFCHPKHCACDVKGCQST